MARRTTHGPLLQRAAEILGGEGRLRAFLVASPERFEAWMSGAAPLPWIEFLKLVDLLSGHYDEQIRSARRDGVQRLRAESRQKIERAKAPCGRAEQAIERSRRSFERALELQKASVQLRQAPRTETPLERHPSLSQRLFAPNFAPRHRNELAEAALEAATAVARTDLGDLQLVEGPQRLRVAARRGFGDDLVPALETVELSLPCDQQTALRDLREATIFDSPRGQEIIEAGSRALVCTPVRDGAGLVLGSINVHFREPGEVGTATLSLLAMVSRRTAAWLEAGDEAAAD